MTIKLVDGGLYQNRNGDLVRVKEIVLVTQLNYVEFKFFRTNGPTHLYYSNGLFEETESKWDLVREVEKLAYSEYDGSIYVQGLGEMFYIQQTVKDEFRVRTFPVILFHEKWVVQFPWGNYYISETELAKSKLE